MGKKLKTLSGRELAQATPRQLEEWMDELGLDIPPRSDSAYMRQAIHDHQGPDGEGGTITTESGVALTGPAEAALTPADVEGIDNPLFAAAYEQVDASDIDLAAHLAEPVLESLKKDDLEALADAYGVEVKRQDGKDSAPVVSDYVVALSDAIAAGGQPPEPADPADPAKD